MKLTRIFSALEFLIGISAVAGGIALITLNGLGMPVIWLDHSPFASYFWPGVILSLIVGGTYLLASILLWKKNKFTCEATATAGFGLLTWVFVELYIINEPHWLQIFYFGFGVLTLVVTLFLLKFSKNV